jgi:hypothetical protein
MEASSTSMAASEVPFLPGQVPMEASRAETETEVVPGRTAVAGAARGRADLELTRALEAQQANR